jgi:hypothetical protein
MSVTRNSIVSPQTRRVVLSPRQILSHLSFIPGNLILAPGTRADYAKLQRFHYCPKPPATWSQIWTIKHEVPADFPSDSPVVPIAIAILSHPCLNSSARDRALNLHRLPQKRRINFINKNIRTISRLIVHPTYRGLGLASTLIRHLLHSSPTRYTESFATMARAHPLFRNSGMTEFPQQDPTKPLYYLHKKNSSTSVSPLRRNGAFTGDHQ